MEKDDAPKQEGPAPVRVYKPSDVHKRRIDKAERRSMLKKEHEAAREQVEKEDREEAEIIRRFEVIHGGRDEQAGQGNQADSGENLSENLGDASDAGAGAAGVAAPAGVAASAASAASAEHAGVAGGAEPAEPAESADAPEEPEAPEQQGELPQKRRRRKRTALIVAAAVISVVVIALGLFSWNRWLRFDDARDIQGEWFAAYGGRRAPITIDGDSIVFNPETTWHYTLDTTAKTITFTFGSQTGGGRYWFVGDHEHLIIEDGVDFSAFDTFTADLQRTLTGKADEVPQGETVTVLSRSTDARSADAEAAVAGADEAEAADAEAAEAQAADAEAADAEEGEDA